MAKDYLKLIQGLKKKLGTELGRLENQRNSLDERISDIRQAIGASDVLAPARKERKPRRGGSRGRRIGVKRMGRPPGTATKAESRIGRRGKRIRNEMSLREAVLQVTQGKSLTRHEILKGVQDLGFKFQTKDPLNSLGTVLYGKKPKFVNKDGKFSQK